MQVSAVSSVPYRPQIKRMNPRDLPDNRLSSDFDDPSLMSTNRRPTIQPMPRLSERQRTWMPENYPPRESNNNNNNNNEDGPCPRNRTWFWVFGGVFCLILVIAVVAIVLGIVLPMTTTTAPNGSATGKMARIDAGTSTPVICSTAHLGSIASSNGSMPPGWRLYSYNYTATQTSPTLSFAFEIHGDRQYYLDEVFVTDNHASSTELLKNPSFDQSVTRLTAWQTSCETSCRIQLVTGAPCFNSSGTCLLIQCTDGLSSPIFVSQSFAAIIGHTYSISYALSEVRDVRTGSMSFYVDVI